MAMARLATGQHGAIEDIERCKQGRCAMTLVVMGGALDVAEAHGQHGLRSLQRLALTLLVHADHQSILRWAKVKADHVAQLLYEERIVGQLESLCAMGLQAKQLKVTLHAGLGYACLGCHRAHAPVRRAVGRFGVQCRFNQLRHPLIINAARRSRSNLVVLIENA